MKVFDVRIAIPEGFAAQLHGLLSYISDQLKAQITYHEVSDTEIKREEDELRNQIQQTQNGQKRH